MQLVNLSCFSLCKHTTSITQSVATHLFHRLEHIPLAPQGAERKATCTALFRKLLYLTESSALVGSAGSASAQVADMRKIFGATDADLDGLRIK